MKKQTLFNPDNSGDDICRTIKTTYHKISTANIISGGCLGASGVLEIINEEHTYMNETNEQLKQIKGYKGMKSNESEDNILSVHQLRMEDGCMVDNEGHKYRIRKLTPTEFFRLMDVEDDDIEKMKQAGIAKTNLYKLAGNSIVVSCMYHIFRKLFIEKDCENEQLSLF